MTLRSVVIDDEQLARHLLIEILGKRPDVEIIGEYEDSRQAIAAVKRDKPDVMFLDIQMPGRDGFEILDALGEDAPHVVFVTAHDEYAVQAFDLAAVDYILKPLEEERVYRAIDRVIARSKQGSVLEPTAITSLLAAMRSQRAEHVRFLPVRNKQRVVLLPVGDISWIEAEGKYVRVYAGGDQHVIRRTMHSLENALDPAKFIRVSRSAIVNIELVSHLDPWSHGEWAITMRSGHRVISSHSYRDRLHSLLRDR